MASFRYVDIAEAIDSADSSYLDGSDFQDADAIPNLEIVPKYHYLRREVSLSISGPSWAHLE